MKKNFKIAITLGCPSGIGPEVIVKALNYFKKHRPYLLKHLLLIGDKKVLEERARLIKLDIPREVEIISLTNLEIKPGIPTLEGYKGMVLYLKEAIKLAKEGKIKGMVTSPISKEGLQKIGISYKGHTEWLAEEFGINNYTMAFYGKKLKIGLVTTHIPLKEVPKNITPQKIFTVVKNCYEFLKKLGYSFPKIALCGLNPHAGEKGILGDEEQSILKEGLILCEQNNIPVYGPYPADSVFYWAYKKKYDMVVALYHDQGLAPFKLVHFEDGVNITLGLPIVRTSPCHGTGYDIADKGIANPKSFIQAVFLCYKLSKP